MHWDGPTNDKMWEGTVREIAYEFLNSPFLVVRERPTCPPPPPH